MMAGSEIFSLEMSKTEALTQAFRKSIGRKKAYVKRDKNSRGGRNHRRRSSGDRDRQTSR